MEAQNKYKLGRERALNDFSHLTTNIYNKPNPLLIEKLLGDYVVLESNENFHDYLSSSFPNLLCPHCFLFEFLELIFRY